MVDGSSSFFNIKDVIMTSLLLLNIINVFSFANLLILSQTSLSENFSVSFRFFESNFLSAPSLVARVWCSTLASRLTLLA